MTHAPKERKGTLLSSAAAGATARGHAGHVLVLVLSRKVIQTPQCINNREQWGAPSGPNTWFPVGPQRAWRFQQPRVFSSLKKKKKKIHSCCTLIRDPIPRNRTTVRRVPETSPPSQEVTEESQPRPRVEVADRRRPHAAWFRKCAVLEKAKLKRQRSAHWSPGVRGRTGRTGGAQRPCGALRWWTHGTGHLSAPTERTPPGANPPAN